MQIDGFAPEHPKTVSDLMMWIERAERIRAQRRGDKNKLSAFHAPEVARIGKCKARKPYEFGVKCAVLVSHQHMQLIDLLIRTTTPIYWNSAKNFSKRALFLEGSFFNLMIISSSISSSVFAVILAPGLKRGAPSPVITQ